MTHTHGAHAGDQDDSARAERLNRVHALTADDREALLYWLAGYCPDGTDAWLDERAPALGVRVDLGHWISGPGR